MPKKNKKILQVHNRYKDLGGEDVVVAREKAMLIEAGYDVQQYIVSNEKLTTLSRKLKTALFLPYSFEQKNKLKKYLKELKPDVVHIHNFLPILTPSIFYACKEEGIPVVLTLHNFRLLCSNGLLYRDGAICEKCITKKWAFPAIKHGCYQDSKIKSIFPVVSNGLHSSLDTWANYIDKVIFLTDFSKEIFMKSNIKFKPSQIVVKPNFVEDRGYCYDKEDYFLFVGRLSEEKGILKVMEACIITQSRLKIAGVGPLNEKVKDIADKHSFIDYLGFQNEEELKVQYLYARGLIFSSQMYEGNPLVILEALSYGTPIIAPDFGNSKIIIMNMKNGILYDPHKEKALPEILKLYNSLDIDIITQGARQSFEKKYTKQINLLKLVNTYNIEN